MPGFLGQSLSHHRDMLTSEGYVQEPISATCCAEKAESIFFLREADLLEALPPVLRAGKMTRS